MLCQHYNVTGIVRGGVDDRVRARFAGVHDIARDDDPPPPPPPVRGGAALHVLAVGLDRLGPLAVNADNGRRGVNDSDDALFGDGVARSIHRGVRLPAYTHKGTCPMTSAGPKICSTP